MRRFFLIFAIISCFLLFIAKAYYDTNAIEVKHYEIKDSALSKALAGLKVAFLTDLHIRSIDVKEKKIFQILDEEKPDLIFLSGDYIRFKGPYDPVISFFRKVKAPRGIYAVFGNTEYSNENGSCVLCHQGKSKDLKAKQHPIFLRNDTVRFEANQRRINILGVDDPVNKKSDLKGALQKADLSLPSILLAHSPEIFEEATAHGIDLVLCGHNHGGQIFLTKHLRNVLPLDPVLHFLEGFFREGKTLMYVSRGIGTSYLPFRLGVKPEITFFEFTNDANKKIRMARIDPTPAEQHRDTSVPPPTSNGVLLQPPTELGPSNAVISNHPPKTIFAGLSLSNLIETFNVFRIFDLAFLTAARENSRTAAPKNTSTETPRNRGTAGQHVLFDFESEEDLEHLNWECHKWFELSEEHASSGRYSLKVSLPPGRYPGIDFQGFEKDWSNRSSLKMEVFNPSDETITFHIRIDDHKSGWEYANRFDTNFVLQKGMNHISIPTGSLRTNIQHRPLNLKRIERMMVFIPDNPKRRELFIDHIRLE